MADGSGAGKKKQHRIILMLVVLSGIG